MTPQNPSKTEVLEEEIEELQRQKGLLQSQYDFADFIETHNLVDLEIERLQQQLLEEKSNLRNALLIDSEEIEEEEEEEEEDYPLPSRFNIEQVVRDSEGTLRPVKSEDLNIDYNQAVRNAFKTIYDWQKRKYAENKADDDKTRDYEVMHCRAYQEKSTD